MVGGGTVGAWCAYFLRRAGLGNVAVIEKGVLGQGSSSRAAGVVRVQGGTPEAVRLGRWSRSFYLRQHAELGTDSGFVQQGYLLPCFTEPEVAAARARILMQQALGLPVRWLTADEVDAINPTMAPGCTLGASYCAEDGYITPPRNVAAYTAALVRAGVLIAERTRFSGLSAAGGSCDAHTARGTVSAGLVVLAAGPQLAAVGALAGITIPAGGVRHHVAVTEEHPAFGSTPMAFDVPSGLYWRPEEGGLLFGMSDPDEPPGENQCVDFDYLALMRSQLAALVPLTAGLGVRRAWAATIDYTPDHLPIIGAAPGLDRVFVAAAGGAGMMWGPMSPTAPSPTARVLLTLEAIQNAPGITASRLGERLGVTERAARRYVAILREAGLPIESVSGHYGGYQVGHGLRLPPLTFTAAEAAGLVMAVLEGHPPAADPADLVGAALAKIVRVLPARVATLVRSIRDGTELPERAHADTRVSPELTGALIESCAAGRRLRLAYHLGWRGGGTDAAMEVDPWAVVLRHSRWYLLCWSHTRSARRVLRVDRIAAAQPLLDTFSPPAGLDALGTLEEHLSQGWAYPVDVLIDASMRDVAGWLPRSLGTLTPTDDGRTRLSGSTADPGWYAGRLAILPFGFRVAGSAELCRAMADLGHRLIASAAAESAAAESGAEPSFEFDNNQ